MTVPTYEYQSQFTERLREQGRAEGQELGFKRGLLRGMQRGLDMGEAAQAARALKFVAGARGITLTPAHQATINDCEQVWKLERWLERAATATSADEIFGD